MTVTNLDHLAALADRQACVDLVYQLARAYDRCDRDMLISVFHPDAEIDYGAAFRGGPQPLADWVLSVVTTMNRTQHHINNVLVNVDGDAAYAESYFIAMQEQGADEAVFTLMSGRYLDKFSRRFGVWKMSHRQAVFEFRQATAADKSQNRRVGADRSQPDPSYAHLTGQPG